MQTYITTEITEKFEDMLFQIAALYTYSKQYNKVMSIPNQDDHPFIAECKMFSSATIDKNCIQLNETDCQNINIQSDKNVKLVGKFKTFKPYNNDTLKFMRYFLYSNEDYMYAAYNKYNKIKQGLNDNDMVSVYIDDEDNLSYYKKALILMNKKNVVVFSSKELSNVAQNVFNSTDYNVQFVWNNNIYICCILMSLFRHNICQYADPFYSIWASYISRYDESKKVIVPDYVRKIMNEKVNNINLIYLD